MQEERDARKLADSRQREAGMLLELMFIFFQFRPCIFRMTATMTEIAEMSTLKSLGISPEHLLKRERNPVNVHKYA